MTYTLNKGRHNCLNRMQRLRLRYLSIGRNQICIPITPTIILLILKSPEDKQIYTPPTSATIILITQWTSDDKQVSPTPRAAPQCIHKSPLDLNVI